MPPAGPGGAAVVELGFGWSEANELTRGFVGSVAVEANGFVCGFCPQIEPEVDKDPLGVVPKR